MSQGSMTLAVPLSAWVEILKLCASTAPQQDLKKWQEEERQPGARMSLAGIALVTPASMLSKVITNGYPLHKGRYSNRARPSRTRLTLGMQAIKIRSVGNPPQTRLVL